jgi:glycosyltransferase involved in cell wall biosynthesis
VDQPLVSVVTPFHNTASFLAQCIESVLTQTYSQFEYILVDNCSTDGSAEIAETYARRDPRIRFIRRRSFLTQVQNYNSALAEISEASLYCKMVQADDYIFPDCLKQMVQAFEQSESVGLVSSHWLKGGVVLGSAFPDAVTLLRGGELARLFLRSGVYVFGSPTTVMYRSSVVRREPPFFNEGLLHEDTEKCMQILEHWDFGFVHQVLSFLRVGNESISSKYRTFQPNALDHYILVQRYATVFLEAAEGSAIKKESKREYYNVLAQAAIRLRGAAFWRYHREGLKTLGETLDLTCLLLQIGQTVLRLAANPGIVVRAAKRSRRKTMTPQVGNGQSPYDLRAETGRTQGPAGTASQDAQAPTERVGE